MGEHLKLAAISTASLGSIQIGQSIQSVPNVSPMGAASRCQLITSSCTSGVHKLLFVPLMFFQKPKYAASGQLGLHGVLLSAAPAQAPVYARAPNEPSPDPQGAQRIATLNPAPHGHPGSVCHAKSHHHRCQAHLNLRWSELERGAVQNATRTNAQNQTYQSLSSPNPNQSHYTSDNV